MIRAFSAITREIEDVESAVAEITSALDPEKNLLKYSLGIISCFSEFEDTGVLEAICEALPFDCIGATTCLCSTNKETDQLIFCITVLTSDDCFFKTTVIPITNDYRVSINTGISQLLEESKEKPELFLCYFPMINASCDLILKEIDKAAGSIPLFGTVAMDHNLDYSSASTIHNGKTSRNAVVLGSIYGNTKFSFAVVGLERNKVKNQKATITSSKSNTIFRINRKTPLEYFKEIGFTKTELENSLEMIPLIVDRKNGIHPVVIGIYALTPEGHALCRGEVTEGSTFTIGQIMAHDILHPIEKILESFTEKDCLILCYSCMARYYALGVNNTSEADKVKEIAGDSQYLFACSGGEICPLPDEKGKLTNFFHSYSIVFCKLS